MNCYRGRRTINCCKQQCVHFSSLLQTVRMPNRNGESAQREEDFRPQSPTRRPRFRHDGIPPQHHTRHTSFQHAPCGHLRQQNGLGSLPGGGGCHAASTKPLLPSVANTNPAEATPRVLGIGSCVCPSRRCSLRLVFKPNIRF